MEYFYSGEIKAKSQDTIEVKLKDHKTFDSYFHAFIVAILSKPTTLVVDYIPYSRADKEIDGELDIAKEICNLLMFSGIKSLVVNGRIHSPRFNDLRKHMEVFEHTSALFYIMAREIPAVLQSYNGDTTPPDERPVFALDHSEYVNLGTSDSICGYFDKVREHGKVVSQTLNITKELSVDINSVVLVDDIIAGGKTLFMAIDELKKSLPNLKQVTVIVDYTEGIIPSVLTYNNVNIGIYSEHELLVREDMKR